MIEGRIKGSGITSEIVPKVNLISRSSYPLGTIVSMWIGSRYPLTLSPKIIEDIYYNKITEEFPSEIYDLISCYPEYATSDNDLISARSVIDNVAKMVIKSNLPPLDSINFTFEIDDASVAFREQLVRGRSPQNFWTQTSRTADLTSMDVTRLPSIKEIGGEGAVEAYNNAINTIRETYRTLTEDYGVPTEDIRLIPQGMTHRIYWMVPFRTLKSTIGKRIGWIAQSSLWSPIVQGIQEELYKKVPYFANILGIPSDVEIRDGKVIGHTYDNENEDRYYARDPQPCDSLWLAYRGYSMPEHTNIIQYDLMKRSYIKIWNKDVCDILGWDKKDPTKLGKYDRPYSWYKEQGKEYLLEGLKH